MSPPAKVKKQRAPHKRRVAEAFWLEVGLDGASRSPLATQLYEQIREGVLRGRLSSNTKLPSSRKLATTLKCARTTIVRTYDQLHAEGFLENRRGSGTFVAESAAQIRLFARRIGRAATAKEGTVEVRHMPLSRRLRNAVRSVPPIVQRARPFAPELPDVDQFPFSTWARVAGRVWRDARVSHAHYADPAGYLPLRQQIARYLNSARLVNCSADQVLITSGTQQSLDLVARILFDDGDQIWVENPGYVGSRGALLAAGLRLRYIDVDEHGLNIDQALKLAPKARGVVVTPAHQYPLGHMMSLARRLQLLEWAKSSDAWIIEDDFDSEFRYAGKPLAPLQSLDAHSRVIYLGTFSKVLIPAFRVGYIVVPRELAADFSRARSVIDYYPGIVVQPVVASFMERGYFAQHIRRMRALYSERQEALLTALAEHTSGHLAFRRQDAGLHLVAEFVGERLSRASDSDLSRRLSSVDISAPPLSAHYHGRPSKRGLLLGFASSSATEIRSAMKILAKHLLG